jgi:CTP:molybdopterin cytidylyltransferase MocA
VATNEGVISSRAFYCDCPTVARRNARPPCSAGVPPSLNSRDSSAGVCRPVRLFCPRLRMRKREEIIPIILAAGSSQVLPFPKALAPFGKKTALDIAAGNCSFSSRVLVVLGAEAQRILPAVPQSCEVVFNRRWREGQLSSLQAALQRIDPGAAFLLYPVDHALITRKLVRQLLRAFRARSSSREIVMPRHKAADGHPVIISAALRHEFFDAATAREVIYKAPERIRALDVRTSSVLEDFDTMESYEECLRKFNARAKLSGKGRSVGTHRRRTARHNAHRRP